VRLSPENVLAHTHLAEALARMGEHDAALDEYRVISELRDKQGTLHAQRK